MIYPNSNWYFKLKGLTFLTIAAAIILIEFNFVNELNIQYLATFLMAIWGIAYLSCNATCTKTATPVTPQQTNTKEKKLELKKNIIASTTATKATSKTKKTKKTTKKKN